MYVVQLFYDISQVIFGSSFDQDGVFKADIFEYSLWQAGLKDLYGDNYTAFNSTLDPIIRGVGQPII